MASTAVPVASGVSVPRGVLPTSLAGQSVGVPTASPSRPALPSPSAPSALPGPLEPPSMPGPFASVSEAPPPPLPPPALPACTPPPSLPTVVDDPEHMTSPSGTAKTRARDRMRMAIFVPFRMLAHLRQRCRGSREHLHFAHLFLRERVRASA